MANLIRAVFALFWVASAAFLGFLVFLVIQTEVNLKMLWSWLVMCSLTFVSVTFLAHNIIFGHHDRANAPHHHTHLNKA